MVGPFPPPRHGVSSVNEAVALMARQRGIAVTCLDTAPPSLSRTWRVRVRRIGRVVRAVMNAWTFARKHGGSTVYFSLSGGAGLVYEAVGALVARLGGAKVVVHHHSYRYIDDSYWAMRLLITAAGGNALHIVLSAEMGIALRRRYSRIREVFALSNAAFVPGRLQENVRVATSLRRVGYLSNLSRAKGIDDLLGLAELSAERGLPFEFIVAGPFEDKAVEAEFMQRAPHLGNVRYIGAVYGAAKDAFFESVDVFVFPTRYRHEAEPIVVLEALSWGCPVVAYARGCLSSMLAGGAGLAIPVDRPFAELALNELAAWHGEGQDFLERRARAKQQFFTLKHANSQRSQELLDLLTDAPRN